MKVQGLTNFASGNGIIRRYNNAKILRNMAGMTALSGMAATAGVIDKQIGYGAIFAIITYNFVGLFEKAYKEMNQLRSQRDEIVARAKKIYSK